MEKEKKEILNKTLYILIIFSFCCAMIYFKNSIISIVLGAIALLFIFLFNKFNKKYAFFIFLLLTCICIPTNEVKAESFNSSFTFSKAKKALINHMIKVNVNLEEYPEYFYFYRKDGSPCHEYKVMACTDIEYYYYWDGKYMMYYTGACYSLSFNNGVTFDDVGNPVGKDFSGSCSSLLDSDSYSIAYSGSGYISIDLSDFWYNDFKVLYAEEDIIFEKNTATTVEQVTVYKKEESDINENFGYDLGNVEGYNYTSIPPKSQVVLYPKTLEPFDFYLFYKGNLDIDILDSVASNISSSTHYSGVLANEYTYEKLTYTEEDANNKRGVYLTNFTDNPTIVGYNPNLFKLLTFNENGLAVDSETDMTFSNTYNTIKSQNNIVDSDDKLGSFDDLISNPKNLASQLIGVFQTIGQLVTIFFASMPEFISQGLTLLFVILIAIAILKALL